MMNRESKAFRIFSSALETLFLAMTGLYLVYRISKSTMFHLVWPAHFERILMCVMAVTAIARLVSAGAIRKKSLAALVLTAIYVLVYLNDRYSFLLFMAIFTVGFIDMDYRQILKVYLLAAGLFYGVTMIAGMLGVITNFVTARAGRGIRSAWGMSYYTDFASFGLFLLMYLWVALKKLPTWTMLLFCAGYLFLSACIAHSNTSTTCACLLVFAVFYSVFERRVVARRKELRWMERGPEWFATYGFPIMALIMFLMMLLFARRLNIGYRLNNLLSKRLLYAVRAWRSYGVKPFGTPFQQHGGGFSVFPSDKYNFVDSTYPLVLLRYGWVLFIALCFTWGWTARKVIACGDRRLLLVMGIILIHALSEHHFVDSHFNILVTMPLAAYPPSDTDDIPAISSLEGIKRVETPWIVTTMLFAVVAWLVGPALLSRMKTVLEFIQYGHGEHALRLVCVLVVVLLGVALSVWAVHRVLAALMSHGGRRDLEKALSVLLLCALSGAGLWVFSGHLIDRAVEQNRPMIQADREALEIAIEASDGRVVSGVLPAAYCREIGGMATAAYFEDDLSRLKNATVLLPSDSERGPFIDSGFLYVKISDSHALYTADRSVVDALTRAGYHPTGYYSETQKVALEDAASLNELEYDPQTGLHLPEGTNGMANGPWMDLYGGKYVATWRLRLPKDMDRSAKTACTLSVTASRGEKLLLDKKVKLNRFDDQGKLTISVPFKIQDTRDVCLVVKTEDGVRLYVEEIGIVRNPAYDVHTFYDALLRKIRDEYYTLDGQRQLRKEGWFARDYAYDRYGNISEVSYYDCDDHLVLINQGYARLRRVFNAKRKIVRQEYLGADDKLIIVSNGYAADEREYDRAGNIIVQRYYGTDGEPIEHAKGYAEIHRVFNGDRQVIKETYYGVDGAVAVLPQGYCGIEQAYDGRGNVAMKRYIDANGAPVSIKNGFAEIRREFDGQGQVIREAYYGTDGEPVLRKGGFAAYDREYDDSGHVILQRYYGVDGKLILIKKGYAMVEREYDDGGKLTVKRYYDQNGALIKESHVKR